MSWSVNLIGKPADVVAALKAESERQTGQCKVEFDDALPHLTALCEQNFVNEGSGYTLPVLHLMASGSGSASSDGKQLNRNCSVKLEAMYAKLV